MNFKSIRGRDQRPCPAVSSRRGDRPKTGLLIEQGGRFIAIECKYSEHVGEGDLKGIKALKKEYGDTALIAGLMASRTPRPHPLSASVDVVPGSFSDAFLPQAAPNVTAH